MTVLIPLVALAAALAAAAVGFVWWRGDGTMRPGSGERIRPDEIALPADAFGARGTLLLFTSDHDTRSPAVLQLLEEAAGADPGLRIARVDLTRRGDLAGRYAVTLTPTVFVLDADSRLRFRLKGAARRADIEAAIASLAPSA